MNGIVKSLAVALALSLAGTSAMACGADGCSCCKDKDAKTEGGKMHDMKGMKGMKDEPSSPKTGTPATPDAHQEHNH